MTEPFQYDLFLQDAVITWWERTVLHGVMGVVTTERQYLQRGQHAQPELISEIVHRTHRSDAYVYRWPFS